MNTKRILSALALSAVIAVPLALPSTAFAREVVREKRVTVISSHDHGDRRFERREVVRRWAPPRRHFRHEYRGRGYGHDDDRPRARYERREYREYRPVEQRRDYRHHDRDGLRVIIGYDFRP